MRRRDQTRALGKPVEHRGRRGKSDMRMQEEEWGAGSTVDSFDANAVDLDRRR
jgi:hypothetical protein